ncbi:hypothetical protein HIM_00334 [Hirsutella minnesotensis 3608]|nr:hypothetical protein HIM_00334 [Hirsutella minnesotensis 3608]
MCQEYVDRIAYTANAPANAEQEAKGIITGPLSRAAKHGGGPIWGIRWCGGMLSSTGHNTEGDSEGQSSDEDRLSCKRRKLRTVSRTTRSLSEAEASRC